MAYECSECARTFVEDYLLANHEVVVHHDAAVHRAEGQVVPGESQSAIAARAAEARGERTSSIFAEPRPIPERRSTTTITGEPGSFQTKQGTDYNKVADLGPGEEVKQVSDKLAGVKQVGRPDDFADSDDGPEAQQYLMQAWQAMALYMANCDDEDQSAALQVLKSISNLMSDNSEPNQPQATGAFGTTSYASCDLAADTYTCPTCARTFSTEQGLINHLKQIHGKAMN